MGEQIPSAIVLPAGALLMGGRLQQLVAHGFHLWGQYATDAEDVPASWLQPTAEIPIGRPCMDMPGLFQICTSVHEYRRVDRQNPLLPLPDTAWSVVPPGVAPYTSRTMLKVRVMAVDGVDQRFFWMDANASVAVQADTCCAWIVAPTGTRDVQSLVGEQRNLPLDGLAFDSFIGASISRIENTPGNNSSVPYTQQVYVPRETQLAFEVPPYAQDLTIYQALQGNPSTTWEWMLGTGGAFVGLGAVPFDGGTRRTPPSEVPACTHLQSDIDLDTDRFFTLRWTIRP